MTRIEWTRKTADEVEDAVSMILCRLNPAAFRVRPSRGDGGIDVCVPKGDGHYEVYQVKKFAENLSPNQKRQIAKSHLQLRNFAAEHGWTIDRWYLVLPLDPTPENVQWFEELASEGSFPCEWRGLSHVEGWVAQFPDVVDYYFEDGRARLQEALAQFTALSGIPMSPDSVPNAQSFPTLAPSDVQNGIAQLRETLNARDPHYLYDFAVSGEPPARPAAGSYPPSLAARHVRPIANSFVTFDVHARCAESLKERPITVTMKWLVATGSVEHREIEEFLRYGRAPEHPITARDISVDLPGGLGQEGGSGWVQVLSVDRAAAGETFQRRLSILSPEDDVVASIDLTLDPPSGNHDGTGLSNRGKDRSGFFEFESLVVTGPPTEMKLRVRTMDPVGLHPDELEPALAMVDAFHAPNKLQMDVVRGPSRPVTHPIPATDADADFKATNRMLLKYVRALSVIQRYTTTDLRFPEFERLSELSIDEAVDVARLLEGEVLSGTWDTMQLTLSLDVPLSTEPESLVADQVPLEIDVGDEHIELGRVRHIFEAAVVVNAEENDEGDLDVTFEPAPENNTVRTAWHGESSIGL